MGKKPTHISVFAVVLCLYLTTKQDFLEMKFDRIMLTTAMYFQKTKMKYNLLI